jgi:hypothetical protein
MGLADWFSGFYANIQVRNTDTISSRYRAITQRLNTDFWNTTSDTAHSLYVGSYGRGTAVETRNGIELTANDPAIAQQMEMAERVMREDQEALRKLAE